MKYAKLASFLTPLINNLQNDFGIRKKDFEFK
jgi:hypothetical protein